MFLGPQLQGEVEVLHTARVRHDWNGGGKLDLSVRQDESVEILRVKNNPGGKWLARSLSGNCEIPKLFEAHLCCLKSGLYSQTLA